MTSKSVIGRFKIVYNHLKNGNLKEVISNIMIRLYSNIKFVGVHIDPKDLQISESSFDLRIRHYKDSDRFALKEGQRHIRLVEEHIPQCYIGVIEKEIPVYRNWVFTQSVQEEVNAYFGPIFPTLGKHDAIIEGVFTHPDYRGKQIMSNALFKILNLNEHQHLKNVFAFVNYDNRSSLKAFQKMGFTPFIIRTEYWRFFRRKVKLKPMANDEIKKFSIL